MVEEKKEFKIDFVTFLLSFASSAQMQMGLVQNPITKKVEKDIPAAKQSIDIIVMLEEKTKGNLSKEEEELLKELLYTLRMQYVESIKTSGGEGVGHEK